MIIQSSHNLQFSYKNYTSLKFRTCLNALKWLNAWPPAPIMQRILQFSGVVRC
jgi:hypothetical protein